MSRKDRNVGNIDVLYPLDGENWDDGVENQFNGAILSKNSIMIREYVKDDNGEYVYRQPYNGFYVTDFITKAALKFQAGNGLRSAPFPTGSNGGFPSNKQLDDYFNCATGGDPSESFLGNWHSGDSFRRKAMRLNYINRIRSIAYVAMMNGYDSIVLGPLGCGAFKNDPRVIADLFYQVFVVEFNGVFKHIQMAYMKFNLRDEWGY